MDDFDYGAAQQQSLKQMHSIGFDALLQWYENSEIETRDDTENDALVICPEPYTIIRRFDDYESNINKCCVVFRELMKEENFRKLGKPKMATPQMYFHSSRRGINFRPGFLNYSKTALKPLVLDDYLKGHVLLVGKTLSGKSELLHSVLYNMLREYSPWEIDFYLADFQFKDKAYTENERESSEESIQYVSNILRKITKLCGDYNEVRDIVALLEYAVMCMDDRLKLFSRMGTENLGEFLDKMESYAKSAGNDVRIILPRKIIFIDRIDAVFQLAGLKEMNVLNECIERILESGAKSGIHLILSGRDVLNRLSEDAIDKFGYQLVMNSGITVSKSFLDDQSAVDLEEGVVIAIDREAEIRENFKAPLIRIENIGNIKDMLSIFDDPGCEKNAVLDSVTLDEIINRIDMEECGMDELEKYCLSFEDIAALKAFVEKKNNTLDHTDFRKGFIRVLSQDEEEKTGRFKKEIHRISYEGEITICPEPYIFLREYDDRANRAEDDGREIQEVYWDILKEDIKTNQDRFKTLDISEAPGDQMWFNCTDRGINLRPGFLNYNRNNPYAVTMGNEFVHGLIVGRTGAGKSVFLNSLIFNMLYEYAPWELDLYLIDFKKVELSRYMSKGVTPHVNACAATSEVRYVVSMIEYLVNCMNARQNFFSRLGVKDVASFRNKVEEITGRKIALPRILLLVDEFQQMFLEATNREADKIEDMLTAITKLGRATGFHLLFASQEMSATLSGSVFANFKIRFALLCESEISSTILGNSQAAHIKIGEVLLNTESGAEEDNKLYKVPFINDKREDVFYSYIEMMREYSEKYGFEKNWKFYEEDRKEKIDVLKQLNKRMFSTRDDRLKKSGGRYIDIMILGDPVVYNSRKKDWETFFIERGSGKNIIAVSPNVDDLVYIQKLLMVNFGFSPNKYRHLYFSLNPIIRNKYKIEDDVGGGSMMGIINDMSKLYDINASYKYKKDIYDLIVKVGENDRAFADGIGTIPGVELSDETKEDILGEDFSYEKIPEICREIVGRKQELKGMIPILQAYHRFRTKTIYDIFDPQVIWISGCDNVGMILNPDTLKNSTSVNMIFVFFATSMDDMDIDLRLSNDYIFIGGNVEQFYDRFDMAYTKKDMDSIVIDFKIRSLNTARSFKKFTVDFEESVAPSINFDEL